MFGFLFMTILLVAFSKAQEDEAVVTNDKPECIRKFIQWCDDRKYAQGGSSMSIMSVSYHDENGYYRVFCSSDSEGTNCSKNGSPWFECKPEADHHTLSYKGQVLSDGSEDVDDDICNTMNKVTKEMFIQNFAFDNATLTRFHHDLGSFFEEIANMQAEMYELQKRLSSGPFLDGFWNGFGGSFDVGRHPNTTEEIGNDQNASKESNQIEREQK